MKFNILITGDYCPIGRNINEIDNNNFEFLSPIAPFVNKADFSITNLEAPITKSNHKIVKSGPNIKAKRNALKPLKDIGFDLVTLANNHVLDFDQQGVKDTIDSCKEFELETVGAGKNLKEARALFISEIKGNKIGVLNFAENEFCSATKDSYGANPVNLISNHNDIKDAKSKVDYLIVITHGGREHYQLPTPNQRKRFRFYADSGADIVVGHHTHCYSGYEIYNETPIFYSLGNFIFDYKKKYQKGNWTQGYAVNFTFHNKNISFELIPYHQGREKNQYLDLFNKDEMKLFFDKIDSLNKIINDDTLFEKSWSEYIDEQKKTYRGMLFLQNKYLRAAMNKGLIPEMYLHSKSHKVLMLNLLRCETHREILIKVLENDL